MIRMCHTGDTDVCYTIGTDVCYTVPPRTKPGGASPFCIHLFSASGKDAHGLESNAPRPHAPFQQTQVTRPLFFSGQRRPPRTVWAGPGFLATLFFRAAKAANSASTFACHLASFSTRRRWSLATLVPDDKRTCGERFRVSGIWGLKDLGFGGFGVLGFGFLGVLYLVYVVAPADARRTLAITPWASRLKT